MSTQGCRRFVILSPYRCGSTLLTERLNAHPDIVCYGELLSPAEVIWHPMPRQEVVDTNQRKADPGAFLDAVAWQPQPPNIRSVGFKLPHEHFRLQFQKTKAHLADIPDLHLVHLSRENLLARYVSLRNAAQTKKWFAFQDTERPEVPPLQIDPVKLENVFKTEPLNVKAYKGALPGARSIDITYEALTGTPTDVHKSLCEFLGVDYQPPKDVSVRLSTGKLSDRIANYDDLEKHFRGTKWADFFTRQPDQT